jgi:hypothetical protein
MRRSPALAAWKVVASMRTKRSSLLTIFITPMKRRTWAWGGLVLRGARAGKDSNQEKAPERRGRFALGWEGLGGVVSAGLVGGLGDFVAQLEMRNRQRITQVGPLRDRSSQLGVEAGAR